MALGWGIVGTGVVADRYVAPGIEQQPDSRIVAAFDVDLERAGGDHLPLHPRGANRPGRADPVIVDGETGGR